MIIAIKFVTHFIPSVLPGGSLEKAINMNNLLNRLKRYTASTVLLGALASFSSLAVADDYNIILKLNGAPLDCAAGGFSFDKGPTAGAFATTNPRVRLGVGCFTDSQGNPHPGPQQTNFDSGNLQVIVNQVTLNGQDQGLNVVGLSSALSTATSPNGIFYTLEFFYINQTTPPTFKLTRTNSSFTREIASGTYHVQNTNPLPEPETLLLLLTGAVGLYLVRRRKSTNRV